MKLLQTLSGVVFGAPTLFLLAAAGVFFTVKTRFLLVRHIGLFVQATLLSLFSKSSRKCRSGRISKLQSMFTSLAATIGTGSIMGVASAIAIGGSGAVFWMWLSAFLGMSTAYAEGVLSVLYRCKNGAAGYISKCSKHAALLYAVLAIAASLGMGNAVQSSSISAAAKSLGVPPVATAFALTALVFVFSVGGLKKTAKAAQAVVPIMSVIYIAGCAVVIFTFRKNLPSVFSDIFTNAFGIRQAVGGGIGGVISAGFRRGVFSNEAGLGTTAAVHSSSQTDEPAEQGMWNAFEVFVDTILLCTLTALAILSSGCYISFSNEQQIVFHTFSSGLGSFGGVFCCVCLILFAFSTILGWSVIGSRAFSYVFKSADKKLYCIIFCTVCFIGCLVSPTAAFMLSDIFNGLMAYPNIAALFMLSGEVAQQTDIFISSVISPRLHGELHGSLRSQPPADRQCV